MSSVLQPIYKARSAAKQKLGRLRFRATTRPTDVFIVTYPKSGTTWLSYLIANVLRPDDADELNLRNFVKYVPDINDAYFGTGSLKEFKASQDPRFFLVHSPYDQFLPRVVYVLRDPRDVMVSYWHYQKLTIPGFNATLKEFVTGAKHWPCEWDEHVSRWIFDNKRPSDLLIVRYEEMQEDTAGVLRKVLDFSNAPYRLSQISDAVEASKFSNMKKAEDRFGVAGAVSGSGESFVRKGRIGGWRDEMDQECVVAIERRYGPLMRRLGY